MQVLMLHVRTHDGAWAGCGGAVERARRRAGGGVAARGPVRRRRVRVARAAPAGHRRCRGRCRRAARRATAQSAPGRPRSVSTALVNCTVRLVCIEL